jgi:hypothetical protein
MGYQTLRRLGFKCSQKMSSQLDSRIQSLPTLWLGFLKETPLLSTSDVLMVGREGGREGGGGGWAKGGEGNKIKNKKSPLKNGT